MSGVVKSFLSSRTRVHIGDDERTYCGLHVSRTGDCAPGRPVWDTGEAMPVTCARCLRVWKIRGGGDS